MAVPAKIRQVGPILVQVQSKMGQVRRFWCAVPDVFGFLVCGQMREMVAFGGMKSARMNYLAPTGITLKRKRPYLNRKVFFSQTKITLGLDWTLEIIFYDTCNCH